MGLRLLTARMSTFHAVLICAAAMSIFVGLARRTRHLAAAAAAAVLMVPLRTETHPQLARKSSEDLFDSRP